MNTAEDPIVVEETYAAPLADVWDALTDVNRMRKWYFADIPAFEAEVGFETQFTVESGGRTFPHLWKITEVVPPRSITYNWKYGGYPGDSLVSFDLFEADGGTMLRLTHRVVESFPGDIPEFQRESAVAGWTYFLRESLRKHLEHDD
ncbi:MAG: SRPBCC domain-containing protein [Akkermansiaceae bacterium]|nr:SRPBCC domain-containing protein [Akkermansiaceae bacterium]